MCLAVGCEDASPAVLETLADVMKHYVATVGVHARNIAENGCRADVTEIDVLTALKQVGPEAVQWPELERFAKQWKQPCPSKVRVSNECLRIRNHGRRFRTNVSGLFSRFQP